LIYALHKTRKGEIIIKNVKNKEKRRTDQTANEKMTWRKHNKMTRKI
jgi:hypothetical protein